MFIVWVWLEEMGKYMALGHDLESIISGQPSHSVDKCILQSMCSVWKQNGNDNNINNECNTNNGYTIRIIIYLWK